MLQRLAALRWSTCRKEESVTALLMFAYSFLAMTSYNIIKPVTRSQFIAELGADNLPYVQLVAGLLIGILMQGYTWLMARLPRRWALPVTQAGMVVLLLAFWVLFTGPGPRGCRWRSTSSGLILGVLLISQFWTLANVVYDPRQAKRLFGFIGGGARLGGIAGSGAHWRGAVAAIGTDEPAAGQRARHAASARRSSCVDHRHARACRPESTLATARKRRASAAPKRSSCCASSQAPADHRAGHRFAAIGAAIIEQQLNMAAAAAKGAGDTDAITAFLAQVSSTCRSIGFVIQVVADQPHPPLLGIGFALLILPVSLGATGVIMLLNGALWAPALARVLDTSLRYTVDKTTREILFLPLPADLKYRAKPFVDVTVDRLPKAAGALLMLVLIKPWGLDLDWQQLSYASLR